MSDSKVYMVPDNVSSGGTSAADMMALMNGNNNQWNNPWIYMVWMMMFRNGFWGNNGENTTNDLISTLLDTINTNHNNDLAMQAIQGNGKALSDLASSLNVGVATLGSAISSIKGAIDLVGAQSGTNAQNVINSVLLGNKDLVQQIASCCCENKLLVTTMGYEGQLRDQTNTAAITQRIDQLSNGMQTGFASTAYATQAQTNALQSSLLNLTQTIMDKISALESNAQQDKINDLTAQLTAANARAERAAELQPLVAQLNAIKSAQPNTVAVTYPNLTAYPSYLNNMYGNYSQSGFWG